MGAVVPTCTFIQEVGQQAAHDCLVADNQDVLLPLQLHDDWLHPLDQVLVGLQSGGGGLFIILHSFDWLSKLSYQIPLHSYI